MKVIDLHGLRFGRLLIKSRGENSVKGNAKWVCVCDCGKETIVVGTSLRSEKTLSCGCLKKERIGNLNRTHSRTRTREYNSWRGMKRRCSNPDDTHYHLYGARGISYVAEWESFDRFYNDMGDCPQGYQLDRVDVNLGYSNENCRWADKTIQAFNIRLKSSNKSGRTGVFIKNGKFQVRITVYKKVIFLGVFSDFEDACTARTNAELKYYGVIKE